MKGGFSAMTEALAALDFSALTATIEAIVPVVLPVIVSVLGIRKGISFLIGCIQGA